MARTVRVPDRADISPAKGDTGTGSPTLLAALVLVVLTTSVVSSLGAPLIPSVAAQFDVSLATAQWSQTVALLVSAVVAPIAGRLGSGTRRRAVVLGGLGLVCLGLVLDVVAPVFLLVVVGRGLQGLGMAMTPLAIATARERFTGRRRAIAVPVVSGAQIAGVGFGYPLAGVAAGLGSVHTAYACGLFMVLCSLLAAAWKLPNGDAHPSGSVDVGSAVLLGCGTASLLLVCSQGSDWRWTSPATLGLAALGIVALAGWVGRSLHLHAPLVDLRLAVRPGVLGPNIASLAAGVGMCLMLTLVIIQVQYPADWGLGRSPVIAGFVQIPYSGMSVIGTWTALRLTRRIRQEWIFPFGCLMYVPAAVGLAFVHGSMAWVCTWMGVAGIGSGCTFALLPLLIVRHIPAHETGSAMAFNQVLRILGFSTGTTIGVTLLELFHHGEPSEHGFTVALLFAAAAMLVAAVLAVTLRAPTATDTAPSTPAQEAA